MRPIVDLAATGICWIGHGALRFRWVRVARSVFAFACTLSPNHTHALRFLAWCQVETGEIERGVESYTRLLARAPDFVAGRVELGEALHELDRYPEAVEHLERAHHESPSDTRVQRALARTLLGLNHCSEPIPLLQEVLRHDSNDAGAWLLLGAANAGTNKWSDAVAAFARAYALDADPQNAVEYVWALIEFDQYVEAESVLQNALVKHGRNALLRSQLASVLTELRRFDEAERILQDVLREDARNFDARGVLTTFLVERGRISEASVVAEALIADFPDDARAYYALGWIELKAHRPADALTAFEAALAREPGRLHFIAGRAAALHGLGRSSGAQAAVRSIVDRDPSFFARNGQWARVGLPTGVTPSSDARDDGET